MATQAGRITRTFGAPGRLVSRGIDSLARLGEQLSFMAKSLWDMIFAIRHTGETARLISEITLGSGALIVGAGTAGVIFFMAFFTGTQVGLEGFKGLQLIGAEAFTGFVSAFANTREITPLIAGVTLAAQVGAGFTAELGAMRVNEEIDALEVMAVRPVPYLVSTRIIAALTAITPLYLISLFSSYIATELVVTKLLGLSGGTYAHYFTLFLPPEDVFYSLIKAGVFAVTVALIHCYYGFNASGGPAGVGIAVGKAIRASIVAVNVLNLMMSSFMWGVEDTVRIAG
ncbi:MAG TPA: ABC transporter permease [Actinomycetota bacterium]|nr:ABC transporter permease [Actinomycetota bacterium]